MIVINVNELIEKISQLEKEYSELRQLIADAAKVVQINDESEIPADADKNTLYVIPENTAALARIANVSEIDTLKAKFATLQSYVENNFARIDYVENNFIQKVNDQSDAVKGELTVEKPEIV